MPVSLTAAAFSFAEVLDDFACDDQACNRWDECGASRNNLSIFGETRFDWLLFGVDDFHVLDATLFAFLSHDASKRAYACLGDIGYLKAGRVQFVSGAHTGNDLCPGFLCLLDQLQFAGYRIDGIHNIIVLGKIELVFGLWKVEAFVDIHNCFWVDIVDASLHDIDLVLPHGGVGCDDLAVEIRKCYGIAVNDVDCADAAACEGLYHIAADATDAKDCHMCGFELFHGSVSQ